MGADNAMPDYKLYCLNAAGRITKRVDLLGCADDAAAIREAANQQGLLGMELWNGSRLVKRFPPLERRPDKPR
jgi:hypothetical protein